MPSFGKLLRAHPYSLEISSTDNGIAKATVTAITIRRDRISEVDSLSGVVARNDRNFGSGVARIIFMLNPSFNGGTITFMLSQSASALTVNETVQVDAQFVFEVE
ncbi:MAG: hypothetical protein ACREQY_11245 [Candidatus Binatia bacterium]